MAVRRLSCLDDYWSLFVNKIFPKTTLNVTKNLGCACYKIQTDTIQLNTFVGYFIVHDYRATTNQDGHAYTHTCWSTLPIIWQVLVVVSSWISVVCFRSIFIEAYRQDTFKRNAHN